MLISTAKHKRIVAEKDAEIAGLMRRLEASAEKHRDDATSIHSITSRYYAGMNENARLQARLAPFTKIRNRDSRGRFIKDTVA